MGTQTMNETQQVEDDWRMFPTDKLYCEGKMKPVFRGYVHFAALISLLPFVFYAMWEDIDKHIEYYALSILVGGTIICWGTSTLFHCFPWQPKQEIFIQRIDHSAVFLQIACNCTPIALVVLHHTHIHPHHITSIAPFLTSLPFFTTPGLSETPSAEINVHYMLFFVLCNFVVVCSFGVYGVWHVFNRRGQRLKYWIFMIALTTPSYPLLAAYMTLHERCLFALVLFINLIGAGVFGTKLKFLNDNLIYQKIANVFGYHEIFHVLTVLGCLCLYFVLDSLNHNHIEERCDIQQWMDLHIPALKLWKDILVFVRITSQYDICSAMR